jgi:hypothetical protein
LGNDSRKRRWLPPVREEQRTFIAQRQSGQEEQHQSGGQHHLLAPMVLGIEFERIHHYRAFYNRNFLFI